MKKLVLALLGTVALSAIGAAAAQPVVFVWYPNESVPEFASARAAIVDLVQRTLGREVREQLTTDYAIAIEALANENAAIGFFGAEGYIQAHNREPAVLPLVVNTDASGSLDNAKYYSMIGTLVENADQFRVNGEFDLSTLRQRSFSFVSSSSTSGFRVPSSVIASTFGVSAEDLLIGGPGEVFSEVMYGGSHQGSLYNVLTGTADVGAFCDTCIGTYVESVVGDLYNPLPGDIIRVKEGAEAPFDQVPGIEVIFLETVPVLNAPLVVNTNLLSEAEVHALLVAFTSDATAANPAIFGPADSNTMFRAGQRFAGVEDAWYDPIRRLAGLE